MPQLNTRKEIEAWLNGQPRDVIAVFAARAALRAVPALAGLFRNSKLGLPPTAIILPSLWAMATALFAGTSPNKAVAFSAASTSAAASAAAAADDADDAAADDAASAASAAYAAHAASAASAAYAADDALYAADDALYAAAAAANAYAYAAALYAAAADAASAAYAADSDIIEKGGTATDLSRRPLWPDAMMPDRFQTLWNDLRQNLLSLDENWEVWTEWYEARLRGEALIDAIEFGDPDAGQYGRITFPQEDYKDAAALNAKLKSVIDDYWAGQLTQDPVADTFALTDDYKIVSATQSGSLALTDTPQQREWYAELRDAVTDALRQGENNLGPAHKPLQSLLTALPENIADGRVPKVWRRANNLRRVLDAHDRALASGEFSLAILSEDSADVSRDVVGTFNNYRIGDTGLMSVEEAAPSPVETEDIQIEVADIAPIIKSAIDRQIAQGEAVLELTDIIEDTADIPTQNRIMGRMQAEQNRKGARNFMLVIWQAIRNQSKHTIQTASSLAFITALSPLVPRLMEIATKYFGTFGETLLALLARLPF